MPLRNRLYWGTASCFKKWTKFVCKDCVIYIGGIQSLPSICTTYNLVFSNHTTDHKYNIPQRKKDVFYYHVWQSKSGKLSDRARTKSLRGHDQGNERLLYWQMNTNSLPETLTDWALVLTPPAMMQKQRAMNRLNKSRERIDVQSCAPEWTTLIQPAFIFKQICNWFLSVKWTLQLSIYHREEEVWRELGTNLDCLAEINTPTASLQNRHR